MKNGEREKSTDVSHFLHGFHLRAHFLYKFNVCGDWSLTQKT